MKASNLDESSKALVPKARKLRKKLPELAYQFQSLNLMNEFQQLQCSKCNWKIAADSRSLLYISIF